MKPEPRIDEDGVGWCDQHCSACTMNDNVEWFCKFRGRFIISTGTSACLCLPYARQQAKDKDELETENKRVRSELAMLLAESDALKLMATQGERELKREIERLREASATVSATNQTERLIYAAMVEAGWIFPTTPEQVAAAEKELAENPIELPDELKDPKAFIARMENQNG